MQERNFEKQVRDKMDELSFVPSRPVWEKVEVQIKRKKEKRRIMFWLLPLIFVSSGLGWWLLSGTDPKLSNESISATTEPKGNYQSPVASDQKTDPDKKPEPVIESKDKKQPALSNVQIAFTPARNNQAINANRPFANSAQPADNEDYISPEQLIVSKTNEDQTIISPALETKIYGFNPDSASILKALSLHSIPKINADSALAIKGATGSKWQIAFAFQGGISGISKGFGGFSKSPAALEFAAPANSPGGSFGSAALPPPSAPEKNVAISAGIDITRKISSRLSVTSGLQYAYYSNSLKVGTTVFRDTSIMRQDASYLRAEPFYRNNTNAHEYTNKLHFIQVPVGVDYQLFKTLPLNSQAGVIVQQLLSSNTLFYDHNSGIYVKDKEMLNRTNVQLYYGISYHFRSKQAFSFAIGPQMQYGLTNLSKNKQNDQRLYFVGISTRFFIKK